MEKKTWLPGALGLATTVAALLGCQREPALAPTTPSAAAQAGEACLNGLQVRRVH